MIVLPDMTQPANRSRGFLPDWTWQIIILLFGITTIAQPYVIPTGSMDRTLMVGDHLMVDKLAFSPAGSISRNLLPYSPVRRGDIIVFRSPINPAETLVKRAIGIPGDRIRIENKQLILNGRRVDEPYKMHITGYLLPYRDTFPDRPAGDIYPGAVDMLRNHVANGEVIVPAGSYFAMGDNRDNSLDSRYWGFIPRENIIGKPVLVFWSFDAPTEHLADGNIRLDHVADVALHFFSKTRWDRTFRLVRGYPLQ